MTRLNSIVGVGLWVIFVHIIAPDLSHAWGLIACLVGGLAVLFLAGRLDGQKKERE